MRSYRRRLLGAIGAVALIVGLAPVGAASAVAPTPSFFPVGDNLNTTAYSLRFAGVNRFATAATTAITGTDDFQNDGYPFDNPDHTGNGDQLGYIGCPDVLMFSAGDTPADALAASGIYDSGSYTLPLVNGGSGSVDTYGPMLLTESARNGAKDLSSEAIAAIAKIRQNCGGAIDGLIFGGPAAVPPGAVSTIDQLLNDTAVLGGVDRFDTAKRIALQVGTNFSPYYPTATSGNAGLSTSVILAEARTGADALAIGPRAAWNNVPVVLTDTNTLSSFSSTTLAGLSPQNIIVAGGPLAISDAVVNAAKAAAGPAAVATRVFGADRYATSVEIAKVLFGYYPENAGGSAFRDLTLGLARSEGTGAQHLGWPDALSSAELLGDMRYYGFAPNRMAPKIEVNQTEGGPFINIGGEDGIFTGWQTPLLLTTQGGLPSSVSTYLAGLYPDSTQMITAANPAGTNEGGFIFTFGGTAAVSSGAELAAAQLVSGGTYVSASQSDIAPTDDAASTFFTQIGFAGFTSSAAGGAVSNSNGDASGAGAKVCALRNALAGVEYMATYNSDGSFDNASQAFYEPKVADNAFTSNQSRFQCSLYNNTGPGSKIATFTGVSLSGHETASKTFDYSTAAKLLQTGGAGADPTVDAHTGDPSAPVTTNGASSSTSQTFTGVMNVTYKGVTTPAAPFALTLNFTRTDSSAAGDSKDSLTFTGTLAVGGGTPIFTATVKGEVLQTGVDTGTGSVLNLAGMYTAGTGLGGFQAVVDANGAGNTNADAASLTGLVVDGLA